MSTRRRPFTSSKLKKNKKSKLMLVILFVAAVLYVLFFYTNDYIINKSKYALENVEANYGHEVDSLCGIMNLPPHFIKALIMLESSGRRPVNPRFEPRVYEKLCELRAGKRHRYESITRPMLRGMNDEALKNLARSWGPFQIMGYKSVPMKVKVYNLRGKDAVYWGLVWIDKDYGNLLRKGKFKDAFHIHNTGKDFPDDGTSQTHDPLYVANGLKYMDYFKSKDNK